MPTRTRTSGRVIFPLTFERGLFEEQEESVLTEGYLTELENWIPEPTGALRVRRRWASGGTSGAPATRRTRGIGSFATQEAFATANRRQATFTDVVDSSAPSGSWAQATSTGNLLLAAITAKRWIRQIKNTTSGLAPFGSTSWSATWSSATTTGNCLIAVVAILNDATSPTVTPPSGWVLRSSATGGPNASEIRVYVIENASSRSGSETFSFSVSVSGAVIALVEYEGVATTSAFDQQSSSIGFSGTATTGTTGTTVQRDEVWFAAFNGRGSWGTPSNGFTAFGNLNSRILLTHRMAEGTGTASCSVDHDPGDFSGAVITLKANIATAPTITTPSGWTLVGSATRTNVRTSLYYIQNAATRSGAQAFTLNMNCRSEIALLEYGGIALTVALDVSATNNGATTTVDSGTTGATTQAQELVMAFLFAGDAVQGAPSNGFSTVGYVAERFTAYEKTVTATGTQNTSATIPAARDWTGIVATFKAVQLTSAGAHYLVADDDGTNFDVWRTSDIASGTWALLDGNVPATSLDRGSPVAFATGLERVLWTHKDFTKTRSWDGNTANAAADVTNAPRGRAMVFYRERFFIGGTKAGAFGANGSTSTVTRLWFSNLGSFSTWGNSDYIDIGREDGEPIEDIAPVGDGLLIAKRSSLWFLSGTGPDNFHLTQLEAGDGYPGRCICIGPHGAMIAGARHMWLWAGGRPEVMSHPVMDSYSIGGSFVSMACAGNTIWVLDQGSGVAWVHDHMNGTWWRELLPGGNDQPAIIHAFEKRVVFGPLASTLIGPLAYRDEPGSTRGRDIGLAMTLRASTPELYVGGAGRGVTPRHLYLELRQRSGDQNDAGLQVTPIYDGVEQAVQTVPAQAVARPFTHRLDIGSLSGVKGVKFRFEQVCTTTDDALMDIERAEVHALVSPHR